MAIRPLERAKLFNIRLGPATALTKNKPFSDRRIEPLPPDERMASLKHRLPYVGKKLTVAFEYRCINKKYLGVMKEILKGGNDVDYTNTMGWTTLMLAAEAGDATAVRLTLKHRANVNHKSVRGLTPLMIAAGNGRTGIIRLLLQEGAKVNDRDIHGTTALMAAAEAGCIGAMRLLLENGADVNVKNANGHTALMQAAFYGCRKAVELLIAWKADIHHGDNQGETALEYANTMGQQEMAELLEAHRKRAAKSGRAGSLEPKTEPPMGSAKTAADANDDAGARKDDEFGKMRPPTDDEVRSVSNMLTEMYENPIQRRARLNGYMQN